MSWEKTPLVNVVNIPQESMRSPISSVCPEEANAKFHTHVPYLISGVVKSEIAARPRLARKWNRGTCR